LKIIFTRFPRLRASPRHGGVGGFFESISNQSPHQNTMIFMAGTGNQDRV
jgi:hypothetical protein